MDGLFHLHGKIYDHRADDDGPTPATTTAAASVALQQLAMRII